MAGQWIMIRTSSPCSAAHNGIFRIATKNNESPWQGYSGIEMTDSGDILRSCGNVMNHAFISKHDQIMHLDAETFGMIRRKASW